RTRDAAAAFAAVSAADLKRYDHAVAHSDAGHVVTHRDTLAESLMAHCMSGRHGQSAVDDRDVKVATGHRQGPDQGLLRRGDRQIGHVAPDVSPDIFECQLLHFSILERSLKYC